MVCICKTRCGYCPKEDGVPSLEVEAEKVTAKDTVDDYQYRFVQGKALSPYLCISLINSPHYRCIYRANHSCFSEVDILPSLEIISKKVYEQWANKSA